MNTDLMQDTRRVAEKLEIGRADAFVQLASFQELRRLRSAYQRQLMGAGVRWIARTVVSLLRSAKASMRWTPGVGHPDRAIAP